VVAIGAGFVRGNFSKPTVSVVIVAWQVPAGTRLVQPPLRYIIIEAIEARTSRSTRRNDRATKELSQCPDRIGGSDSAERRRLIRS
jgi:hypothetical protein